MKYPLATDTWDEREYAAMHRVISSKNFTMGKEVFGFEREFAAKFSVQHAVMSNSGSSANLLALAAIKYSSFAPNNGRNEVIVPAVSWSTTYYPVSQMGYKLRFVDVDVNTLNASPEQIEKAISSKTAGILAVNLLGNPSKLIEISSLARQHGLFMLEDNCESMGATYGGQPAGTFGDIGTFSSFFSHHISTMEGGISLTNSEELRQVMVSLRAHGWTRELPSKNFIGDKSGQEFYDLFRFVLPGYNLRPLELQGALGRQQIEKLDGIVQGRRANAVKFQQTLANYPDVLIQQEVGESSWFGFSMILTGRLAGLRDEFVRELNRREVDVRPIVAGNFTRNPVMKHLAHCEVPDLAASDMVHNNGLFVGNHHYEMSEEFDAVEGALKQLIKS